MQKAFVPIKIQRLLQEIFLGEKIDENKYTGMTILYWLPNTL